MWEKKTPNGIPTKQRTRTLNTATVKKQWVQLGGEADSCLGLLQMAVTKAKFSKASIHPDWGGMPLLPTNVYLCGPQPVTFF